MIVLKKGRRIEHGWYANGMTGVAHDIERICYHPEEFTEEDIAQAKIWQEKYAEYRAGFPADCKQYKHFYGWMYSEILRCMRSEAGLT